MSQIKKIHLSPIRLLQILFLVAIGIFCVVNPAVAQVQSIPTKETRAIWANAVESPGYIDYAVDRMIDAKMNVLLYRTYGFGTAYFDMDRVYNQTPFFKGPEFSYTKDILPPRSDDWVVKEWKDRGLKQDALQYIIDKRKELRAKGYDFEIHLFVGINEGGEYDSNVGSPPRPSKIKSYMLFADGHHPEFKGVYYSGIGGVNHQYGCIDQPMYQHWLVSMLAGVTQAYKEIDGVHLDYVRSLGICFDNVAHNYNEGVDGNGNPISWDYPGSVQAYKDWTKKRYNLPVGRNLETDAPWGTIKSYPSGGKYYFDPDALKAVSEWEQYNVDKLVEAVSREVKKVKPSVIVTAAINQKQPWNHCKEINPNETDCTGKYGHHPPEAGFTNNGCPSGTKCDDDLVVVSKDIVQGQSAWKWLVNGWLDAAFPFVYTNYLSPTGSKNGVYDSNKLMRTATGEYAKARGYSAADADAFARRMFQGIETFNMYGDNTPDSGPSIGGQIKDLRNRLGNKGIALFDSKYVDNEHVPHFSIDAASYIGNPANNVYPSRVMPEWFQGVLPSPQVSPTPPPSIKRLLGNWLQSNTDLNGDGKVNSFDFSYLLQLPY